MQHLLDHIADIPTLLAQFDSIAKATNIGFMSSSELIDRQTMLWTSISDVERRLRQWKREWADHYPTGQLYGVPHREDSPGPPAFSNLDDRLPIFRCRDLITLEVISPAALTYPDPQVARTLCWYYAALIILSGVDTRPVGGIQPNERFNLSCLICRSAEYYFRTLDGNLVNRVMFPLRVAYDALPEGIEKQWLEELSQWVERKKLFKAWGRLLPEISVETRES